MLFIQSVYFCRRRIGRSRKGREEKMYRECHVLVDSFERVLRLWSGKMGV